jgi:hypothetical protein
MSDDLEKNLRRALRPVDPGDEFTRRVMEGIENSGTRRRWFPAGRQGAATAVALAASVVLVVVGVLAWKQRHEAEGLAARAQVIEALRVTSDKLDLASRLVNTPPQSSRGDEPGA